MELAKFRSIDNTLMGYLQKKMYIHAMTFLMMLVSSLYLSVQESKFVNSNMFICMDIQTTNKHRQK